MIILIAAQAGFLVFYPKNRLKKYIYKDSAALLCQKWNKQTINCVISHYCPKINKNGDGPSALSARSLALYFNQPFLRK
jgi:hypothetical protein